MKMDIDCIRDILLQAEDKRFTIFNDISDEDNNETKIILPFIKKYNNEKLLYHIYLADELGLLKTTKFLSGVSIDDLSAQGHLFLADIREDNVWNKTNFYWSYFNFDQ